MISIMIVTDKNYTNEVLGASIIGGMEESVSIMALTDSHEAENIIQAEKHEVDIFIFKVKMRTKSGKALESTLRQTERYKNSPVLFITDLSYNLVGFPDRAGYQSYKKENYISMPIQRLDVQAKIGLYIENILKTRRLKDAAMYIEHTNGEAIVHKSDLLYAEVQNKIVKLHCKSQTYEIKRISLQDVCEIFGKDYLIKCHKSFAINTSELLALNKDGRRNWLAVFENDSSCPVSQTYFEQIKTEYKRNMTK